MRVKWKNAAEEIGRRGGIVSSNIVGDIDDLRTGAYREDDPLHRRGIRVGVPEIGEKSDEAALHHHLNSISFPFRDEM